jgi:DNA-binding HxlR family transcriptional regulator
MLFNGKSTYGQFLQSEEKIATNILTDRLAVLEA